jgi:histidyl-tRNA synthetase
VDAEVIALGADFLRDCGVEYELLINSIGHVAQECRLGYVEELRTFLAAHREELDAEDRDRATTNPLRVFDSKSARTAEVLGHAPLIGEHLCAVCSEHFATVRELLGDLGVEHRLEPRLVRGLDYYTHTAFEFTSAALGAQSTVLGGGRYDGLAETLGGPPFPGMGFAIGIDRLLLAATTAWPAGAPIAVYVVAITDEARRVALRVVFELRRAGIGSDLDLTGRGLKGQMKAADRSGARWAVIVGEDELVSDKAQLKDLGSGDQELIGLDEILERVR